MAMLVRVLTRRQYVALMKDSDGQDDWSRSGRWIWTGLSKADRLSRTSFGCESQNVGLFSLFSFLTLVTPIDMRKAADRVALDLGLQ
jgi:hypothetical protein